MSRYCLKLKEVEWFGTSTSAIEATIRLVITQNMEPLTANLKEEVGHFFSQAIQINIYCCGAL
jgi:hypothetical protein